MVARVHLAAELARHVHAKWVVLRQVGPTRLKAEATDPLKPVLRASCSVVSGIAAGAAPTSCCRQLVEREGRAGRVPSAPQRAGVPGRQAGGRVGYADLPTATNTILAPWESITMRTLTVRV